MTRLPHDATRLRFVSLLTAAALFGGLAGCPMNGGDGGDGSGDGGGDGAGNGGATALVGTWTGQLSCTRTQTIEGSSNPAVQTSARDLTITFDANGRPTDLVVYGYSGQADQTVQLSQVGQSQTVNATSGSTQITQVVTVTQAIYTSSSAHLELEINYDATQSNLTYDGTATLVIDASASADGLRYTARIEYHVTLAAGTISIPTNEVTECTGTLAKQP